MVRGSARRFLAGLLWSRHHPSRLPLRGCLAGEHEWERVSTLVVPGKPLLVEFSCRRCGSWAVEETRTW